MYVGTKFELIQSNRFKKNTLVGTKDRNYGSAIGSISLRSKLKEYEIKYKKLRFIRTRLYNHSSSAPKVSEEQMTRVRLKHFYSGNYFHTFTVRSRYLLCLAVTYYLKDIYMTKDNIYLEICTRRHYFICIYLNLNYRALNDKVLNWLF